MLKNKRIPSSSLYSDDIRNRNSFMFKENCETMDLGARLGVSFKGGRNFILKTFVEMQEAELAERINALDDLEIYVDLEDDQNFKEGASLSLDF